MPLLLPNLDDRRWTDLVDEGRSLIPLYAPGWTDHNVHDPGITFLELFAAQAEIDLYRVNRVPPAHVKKFLALVGAEPRPPRAARTVLAFRLKDGKRPLHLPAGLEVEAEDLAGVRTVFRTLHPFTAVAGLALEALQTGGRDGFEDLTARRRRGETLAPFGDDPAPGAAFYLGLDRPLPVGVPVSVFFTLPSRCCLTPLAPLSHPLPPAGRGGRESQRVMRGKGGGAPLPVGGRGWGEGRG